MSYNSISVQAAAFGPCGLIKAAPVFFLIIYK